MRKIIVAFLLTATIVLSSVIMSRTAAQAPNLMWIDPANLTFSTNTTSVGSTFNVAIWLNNTQPANSWQFYLIYNRIHLNATACVYSGSGKSLWSAAFPCDTVSPSFDVHNDTFNFVFLGEVLKSSALQTNSASLAIVTFRILVAPGEGETLSSELRLDVAGLFNSFIMDSEFNDLPLSLGKSTYTFVGAEAPPVRYSLILTATAGGTTDPAPGTHFFDPGTLATVTAYPTPSTHKLDHWELDGANIGAANPVQVTMNTNHTLLAVFATIPPPPTTSHMWTEPTLVEGLALGGLGAKFNVTIWLNMTMPANAWQFYMVYNKLHLTALRCGYTGAGKSLWSGSDATDSVSPLLGSHNSTFDYVAHGEVLRESKERTGYGSLSWVEFQIIAEPPSGETLTSELRLDDRTAAFYSYVIDSELNELPLSFGGSTYTFGLPPPENHDVAVTNVSADPTEVYVGESVTVYVTVANQGSFAENATISCYGNASLIGASGRGLMPGEIVTIPFLWDTSASAVGSYLVYAEISPVPGETDLADNSYYDGLVRVKPSVTPFLQVKLIVTPKTLNLQSCGRWITAHVILPRRYCAADVDFSRIRLNGTISPAQFLKWRWHMLKFRARVLTLKFSRSAVVELIRRQGLHCGRITLVLTGFMLDGTAFMGKAQIRIRELGDVDGNGIVDVRDIARVSGSLWKMFLDVDEDGKIDVKDVAMAGTNSERAILGFGSKSSFNADIDESGHVDMKDVAFVSWKYGTHYP